MPPLAHGRVCRWWAVGVPGGPLLANGGPPGRRLPAAECAFRRASRVASRASVCSWVRVEEMKVAGPPGERSDSGTRARQCARSAAEMFAWSPVLLPLQKGRAPALSFPLAPLWLPPCRGADSKGAKSRERERWAGARKKKSCVEKMGRRRGWCEEEVSKVVVEDGCRSRQGLGQRWVRR